MRGIRPHQREPDKHSDHGRSSGSRCCNGQALVRCGAPPGHAFPKAEAACPLRNERNLQRWLAGVHGSWLITHIPRMVWKSWGKATWNALLKKLKAEEMPIIWSTLSPFWKVRAWSRSQSIRCRYLQLWGVTSVANGLTGFGIFYRNGKERRLSNLSRNQSETATTKICSSDNPPASCHG